VETDNDEWDREMTRDFSPGGKGEWLLEEAMREMAEGKTVPLGTVVHATNR
jgi:hypothetical protein